MFKFSKISNKLLIGGLFLFNLIFLISFIFFILLSQNLVPSYFYYLTIPLDLLSHSYLFVFLILAIESLIIFYFWYKNKKQSKFQRNSNDPINNSDIFDENDLFNNFEESNEQNIKNVERSIFEDELFWDDIRNNNSEISEKPGEIIALGKEDSELTPEFLEMDDNLVDINSKIHLNLKSNNDVFNPRNKNNKTGINDLQYAFYQKIISLGWLYEKHTDRNRIGFERDSIDESNFSLSDLNKLIQAKMVFKKSIPYPMGAFTVYTADNDIEIDIIRDIIRRILRKNRLKMIIRKIEFINWCEFGLLKKTWQFDFEIISPPIIGSIWDSKAFTLNPETNTYDISQIKKDELKALIAAATLKLKEEGLAVIITTNKEYTNIIKKFIKNTGWGDVEVIDFSNNRFFDLFLEKTTTK